jgi:hypothetical protein
MKGLNPLIDYREELRFYHPELIQDDYFHDNHKPTPLEYPDIYSVLYYNSSNHSQITPNLKDSLLYAQESSLVLYPSKLNYQYFLTG